MRGCGVALIRCPYLALLVLVAPVANAAGPCVTVGINDSGVQRDCGTQNSSNAGTTRPTSADGLATNPATLPVQRTPWGFEFISSSKPGEFSQHYATAGIIRGFKGFGLGFGSDTDGTFYSNRASAPVERDFPSMPGFNFGAAFAVPFVDPAKSLFVPVIGLALKVNIDSASQGYSAGLNFAGRNGSIGFSYQREPSDVAVPDQTSWNIFSSITGGPLSVDLSYGLLRYVTAAGVANQYNSYTGTLSVEVSAITLVAAYRVVDSASTSANHTRMYGVMLRIFSRLRLGYFYDYRPRSQSIGLQALLF